MLIIDIELDKEELNILKGYEQGKFKSVPNLKREQKRYQEYAKAMLNKTKNINIRVSESDLLKVKPKAVQKGLPLSNPACFSHTPILHRPDRTPSFVILTYPKPPKKGWFYVFHCTYRYLFCGSDYGTVSIHTVGYIFFH